MENLLEKKPNKEIISAGFIIIFVSIFVLSSFIIGFNLPAYLIFMSLAGIISFFYPRSGLFAIIFLTFIFERFFTLNSIFIGTNEYKIYPIDVIFIFVILGTWFQIMIGKINFHFKKIDFLLILFIFSVLGWFLGSIYFLDAPLEISFSSLKNYAFYPIFYLITIALVKNKSQLKDFLKVGLGSGIAVISFIILGIIFQKGIWSDFTPLSTGGVRYLAFTHGFYLSIAFLGLLIYLIFNEARKRNFYFIILFVWLLGIIGSLMRHLWIGIGISIALLFILLGTEKRFNFRKIVIRYVWLFGAIFTVIFFGLTLFPNSNYNQKATSTAQMITNRFSSISNLDDESYNWRSVAWKEALIKYAKSPVLGFGFGQSISVEIEKYRDFVEVRNIHNSWLVILIQMGIFPFLSLTTLVGKSLFNLIKTKENSWIRYFLISAIFFNCFIFLFQPYLETNLLGIFFWIFLGLSRNINEIEKQ